MANQAEAAETIRRYLKARVPIIIVRSIERSRALETVRGVGQQFRTMVFYRHSRATGLSELNGGAAIMDDRSLVGALDYASSTFLARQHANFVFTDIDDLQSDSTTARHVAEVARIAEENSGSVVLITSEPVWSGLARLGMPVTLDLPDLDELYRIVSTVVEDYRVDRVVEWRHDEIRRAAEILVGVTETEALNALTTLVAKGSLLVDDVAELSQFKDRIFGDLSGIERVKVSDSLGIGGLVSLRKWLDDKNELMKADLSGTNLHAPRGVLLVGVPGCGKSLSAKVIASEWKIPLYRLDMASILGMYVGLSESRFKEALDTAERVAPCVLWVDEIEKAFSTSANDGGVSRRLVGQFLYWLQESAAKVFVVATANDVSSLPPELLRKGRFDEIFFVDLPDDEDRADIIRMYYLQYLKSDPSPYEVRELAELSHGFGGNDIEAVLHDLGAYSHLHCAGAVPGSDIVRRAFSNVVPFSQTNPEEVAAIRSWGNGRAVPAGREVSADGRRTNGQSGVPRRVLLSD